MIMNYEANVQHPGRTKDSATHTLRWAAEFSQRENFHHPPGVLPKWCKR